MKVVAALVVGSDGHTSVWPLDDPDPNRDQGAMMNYCLRVHGVFHELVAQWEAEQEKKEAYERGLREGLDRSAQLARGSSVVAVQTSSSPVSVGNGNDRA